MDTITAFEQFINKYMGDITDLPIILQKIQKENVINNIYMFYNEQSNELFDMYDILTGLSTFNIFKGVSQNRTTVYDTLGFGWDDIKKTAYTAKDWVMDKALTSAKAIKNLYYNYKNKDDLINEFKKLYEKIPPDLNNNKVRMARLRNVIVFNNVLTRMEKYYDDNLYMLFYKNRLILTNFLTNVIYFNDTVENELSLMETILNLNNNKIKNFSHNNHGGSNTALLNNNLISVVTSGNNVLPVNKKDGSKFLLNNLINNKSPGNLLPDYNKPNDVSIKSILLRSNGSGENDNKGNGNAPENDLLLGFSTDYLPNNLALLQKNQKNNYINLIRTNRYYKIPLFLTSPFDVTIIKSVL